VQALQRQHAQADTIGDSDKLGGVDMNSATASETVSRLVADAEQHTRDARKELALAQDAVASAPDSTARAQWNTALDEYEQAMDAHDELFSATSAFSRQLTVAGIAETEIPATVGDLAAAWMMIDMNQPKASEDAADIAYTNFGNLAAELDCAHRLEPAAGLDSLRDLCLRQQKIAALLRTAGASAAAGHVKKANKLIKQAQRMEAALEKDGPNLMQPAIWSDGYADRFKPARVHEDQHFAAAAQMMQALTTTK